MKTFNPNRNFRRDYDRIFKKNPAAANMLLLLCELSDERGQVMNVNEMELALLFNARFDDPKAYHLEGGPKR